MYRFSQFKLNQELKTFFVVRVHTTAAARRIYRGTEIRTLHYPNLTPDSILEFRTPSSLIHFCRATVL